MKKFLKRNGSTILTVLAGVGVVVTTISSSKATIEALDIIEQAEQEKGEELTTSEKVKTVGKFYIPSVIFGTATIACIFGANILNKKQQASLASAYALIDNSYREYKRKLIELHGEETHQSVIDAIAVEKAKDMYIDAPALTSNNSLNLENSTYQKELFYDELSNRYFETTLDQVMAAEYHLNRNYVLRGYTVLNEFYEFLGIDQIDEGYDLGWTVNDDEIYWIDFNHRKVMLDSDIECTIIEMPFYPSLDWMEYWGFDKDDVVKRF